ncbi:MAG: response regulator transcription factor [Burkholderiaceae bacterium]|nr:response regulator transcription factor [Burkholderiaceae bacterium]
MNARKNPNAAKMLLVDDHTIVREGLKRVLEPIAGDWEVTEVGSGFQALEIMRHQDFSLAIVDLSMPGMTGLELIKRIKAEHPSVAVLVLSMHAEEQYAIRAFKAGACGYVTKDSAATELVAAVRKAASGGAYVSASLAERVVQQLNGAVGAPRHAELSNRELEVLQRIVAGQRLTDIADELHLSVKTVSTHKTRIQEKLQLPSMAALIRYGLEHQIGTPDSNFGRAADLDPMPGTAAPPPPSRGDGI